MAAVTIRNLRPETHRAIKARAKAKGRSAEAEMRAILDEAVLPKDNSKIIPLNASELNAAILRVAQFADERSRAVRLKLEKGELKLSA